MKKFILKAVVFSFLFLSVVFFVNKSFCNIGLESYKTEEYNEFKESGGSIDIALFGSSHTLCSYDPRVFEAKLNTSTFNFGISSQRLITTTPVIQEVLENNDLQLAIVDVFKGTLSQPPYIDRVNSFQLKTFDYLPFSIEKLEAMEKIYGGESILEQIPIFRAHSLWENKLTQEPHYFKESQDYYKGYYSDFSFNKKRWERAVKNKKIVSKNRIIPTKSLSQEQMQTIDRIIQKFKDNNIPFIFVNAPLPKGYRTNVYYTYQELIRKYLKSRKVEYIDFNDLYDTLNITKWDFKDAGHLNSRGAAKVSNYLAEFVKKNYQIKRTQQGTKYLGNRYYHIDTDFKYTLSYKDIKDQKLINELGVEKLVVYKTNDGNLEIMFLGKKGNLKYISTTVSYQLGQGQTNVLEGVNPEFKKYFNKGIYKKETNLTRGLSYNEYEVKTLRIPCHFEKIVDFKVFVGGHNLKQQEVLSVSELNLKM
ncbi:SGNH/GDSL hydrolase family protein [Mangrovimonas aestuarii]|uniref:SGNH/GDSL hydrolase family protein n=1 Tax=Mangrovimonas aestuarii TaxID=3018443 RepID=UPI002378548B|nr:SGNH/GDSL hydrolase family protein [Mangrovimonas aestuarii]